MPLQRGRRTVALKFRKEVQPRAHAGWIHCGQVVPVMHPYDAVPQGMNLPRLHTAMLVSFRYFAPLFAAARDNNTDLALKVFGWNRLLVPITDFAVSPSSRDRTVWHHSELCRRAFEGAQEVFLVPRRRPVEPRAIDEKTSVFEPHGQGKGLAVQTAPTPVPPRPVVLRELRRENVSVRFDVRSVAPGPSVNEVVDYLLV